MIRYRQAETAEEMRQIHALNHRTFAEEIEQHPRTADGLLVDRFHEANVYFIALEGARVVGMMAVHAGPEFSVARRLPDASVLRALRRPLEVRLLAVEPEYRGRTVLAGLFALLNEFALRNDYSDLLISGIVERQPMYRKLGFIAMGPAVPDGIAAFVPMRMSLDDAGAEVRRRQRLYGARWKRTLG